MRKNVIAAGHEEVVNAARIILEEGGNAFDAVIAAGFASTVAEPALTSLGGGGFLLARTKDGETTLFDFFVDTPGQGLEGDLEPHFFPVTVHFPGCSQDFNIGMASVAVPGNLMGFCHCHERLGVLPLRVVLEPAIRLARKGVRLNSHQAYFLSLLRPIMTLSKEGRAIFAPSGDYVQEGQLLLNPDLAAFLEELGKNGPNIFYTSETAQRIHEDMVANQGLLTKKDLASYRVKERTPLKIPYKNFLFYTNPPPSFGGPLIALALRALDAIDLSETTFGSLMHMKTLAYLLKSWEGLREKCPPSHEQLCPELKGVREGLRRLFSRGTTHVSIVDADGNAAGMTCSNGEGSGYIVPGTGIMLNNMMGEDDLHPDGFHSSPPGIRVASMMSPSLITTDDGDLMLVLGSGGSKRIRSAILQVALNFLSFNMSIKAAVEAPRMHFDGKALQVEPGFSRESLFALAQEYELNLWDTIDLYFGGVHAVDPKSFQGAGDPRRGGRTLAF